MLEFLQSYGIWIFFGLLFLLMRRGRGRGMGCCGGQQHDPEPVEAVQEAEQPRSEKRSSSCH